jgi:group I intron endonuclease
MNIYTIYRATNTINGKIYIGFDSNWPKRKSRHINAATDSKNRGYNDAFHKALRKYTHESFEWDVIYQSVDSIHCLNVMEKHFIIEHNSYINAINSNGYNMTLGGEGTLGYKRTEEIKKKISDINKNRAIRGKKFKVWNEKLGILDGNSIAEFCRIYKLECGQLAKLIRGDVFKYGEFLKYDGESTIDEAIEKYHTKKEQSMLVMGEKHSKTYKLKSPNGDIVELKNLSKFCRDNDLNHRSIRHIIYGRCNFHKGWTIP